MVICKYDLDATQNIFKVSLIALSLSLSFATLVQIIHAGGANPGKGGGGAGSAESSR